MKKTEQQSTSAKSKGQNNKDPPTLSDCVFKKLNSIAFPQKLRWLTAKYSELVNVHEMCEPTIKVLQELYGVLQNQKQLLIIQYEKHSEGVERFLNLWTSLNRQTTVLTAASIEEAEAGSRATISAVTKKLDNKSLDQLISFTEAYNTLYKEFKDHAEGDKWLFEQVSIKSIFVELEIDKATSSILKEHRPMIQEYKDLTAEDSKGNTEYEKLMLTITTLNKMIKRYIKQRKARMELNNLIVDYKDAACLMQERIYYLKQQLSMLKYKTEVTTKKASLIYFENKNLKFLKNTTNQNIIALRHENFLLNKHKVAFLDLNLINNINPSIQCYIGKELLPSRPEELLKSVKLRMYKAYEKCSTIKERQCAWILLNMLKVAKTQKDINNITILITGFMNYNCFHKHRPIDIEIHASDSVLANIIKLPRNM